MKPIHPETYKKATVIVGAILVTAAVSGYFMGLLHTSSQLRTVRTVSLAVPDPERHAMLETETAPVAVAYAKQDWLRDGANAGWQNHLANLVQPPVDLAAITNRVASEAERAEAIREREERRAFAGAPPLVPHPIVQDSAASCLACHGPGLVIKDRVASRMSHPPYASCTQCHVPAGGLQLPIRLAELSQPLAENRFVALPSPRQGVRAWPGAPPGIPHGTHMREDCLSCHGPRGLAGLRTSHPDRQSCLQCHAPNADLDQHLFFHALLAAVRDSHQPRMDTKEHE